jgi:hypothetical protein
VSVPVQGPQRDEKCREEEREGGERGADRTDGCPLPTDSQEPCCQHGANDRQPEEDDQEPLPAKPVVEAVDRERVGSERAHEQDDEEVDGPTASGAHTRYS